MAVSIFRFLSIKHLKLDWVALSVCDDKWLNDGGHHALSAGSWSSKSQGQTSAIVGALASAGL